jgi:multidrug resistance efflux pump
MPDNELGNIGFERHSEQFQDIITTIPNWALRWGITAVILVTSVIIGMTVFIRYPETVTTQLILSPVEPNVKLESGMNGRITRLLVNNDQKIDSGKVLILIESAADFIHVPELVTMLQRGITQLQSGISTSTKIEFPYEVRLPAELEPPYQIFLNHLLTYQDQNSKYLSQRKKELEKDLHRLLLQNQYQNSVGLKAHMLAKQREMLGFSIAINKKNMDFLQALKDMLNITESWQKEHMIIASRTGKLKLPENIQLDRIVANGQPLAYIVPERSFFFGEMYVQQDDIEKIDTGQLVSIKLLGFRVKESGNLKGIVEQISGMPDQNGRFKVRISVKGHLDNRISNYIGSKGGMSGEAIIITKEMTLIQRVMKNYSNMLNNEFP